MSTRIILALILGMLVLPSLTGTSLAQTPSVVHCTVNARATRAFAEDIGWYGPLPDIDSLGRKPPDASKPFQLFVAPSEEIFFSEYIFSELDTEQPHVRAIPHPGILSDGQPLRGNEREATVIKRTSSAIYFIWEGAPGEMHSVVLHLESLKVAIGRTSSGPLVAIGVSGFTADCR